MTLRSAPCIDGACARCPRGLTCRCECHDYVEHGISQMEALLAWTEPGTVVITPPTARVAYRPRGLDRLMTDRGARDALFASAGLVVGLLAAILAAVVTKVAGL